MPSPFYFTMSRTKIRNKWKKFFKSRGLESSLTDSYLAYIDKLLSLNLPIIFESEHLAKLLGRSFTYINSVVYSPQSHYRKFKLKKRSGGFREIDIPYPALLECQYWILENILSKIPISYCAHGFAKKKSIITNSKIHINQQELLKIDLKDFFPSVNKDRVIALFHRLGYTTKVAHYLGAICCLEKCLPQGAPTSPIISNIVSIKLDNRLLAFAKKMDLRYTRYADDLAFSGNKIPVKYIDYVSEIIQDEGFSVNKKKTKLYNSKGKRILTGVSISTDKLKAPKEYKRKVFQEIHYINTYGLYSHMIKMKIRNPYYLNSLIGKLNYILNIEPDNSKALKYRDDLKQLDKAHTHNIVYKQ